jgi:signal transduction histidine kinase
MAHSNQSIVKADSIASTAGTPESSAVDDLGSVQVPTFEQSAPMAQDSRLHVTFEIAKILVAEHDLEIMLPQLLSALIQTMDAADAGSVWLYDPSDGRLSARGAQGYNATALKKLRLTPGEAMAGRVFQTGQGKLYPTPESTTAAMSNLTPANQKAFEEATAGLRQPLSAVCVPLATAQTAIGVLVLLNLRRSGSFTQRDLELLQRLASLITLSFETALLREELEDARTLSEANRLKAELISTLAHEMRTPLTSIKGYSTALLLDEVTFSQETQHEFLRMIDEECDILQDLIRDLLESSIIDAGLLRLEVQPVRLPHLVQDVIDELVRRTSEHRFMLDFPEDFPLLDADPDRLLQVLRNLLDNAVKYSPDGGLIVVRGTVQQKEVIVSVADQGIGLVPEHLNRLFEKFFRAKSSLGGHVVGSGLGLPISRTIVEAHGGWIWAESQLGQGTTLYFTLPRENRVQAPEQQEGISNE